MKSFKAMMAEVAQPESEEEKAFKAQHKVVANNHPVDLDHQHTGEIAKPKAKRKADQEGDAAYDMAYESVEQLDELSPNKLHAYIKGASADMKKHANMAGYDARSKAYGNTAKNAKRASKRLSGITSASGRLADKANMAEDASEEIPMMTKQLEFIMYAAKEIKASIAKGDPEEWYQNKLTAAHEAMKTLHANLADGEHTGDDMDESAMAKRDALDKASAPSKEGKKAVTLKKAPWEKNEELSSKQKKIDHNKNGKIDGHDLAMIRAKKNEASCGTSKKSYKEEVELDEAHSTWDVSFKSSHKPQQVKARNTAEAIKKASKKAQSMHAQPTQIPQHKDVKKVSEEVEILDEAFAAGIVKLKDNSSMVLKKEDADLLNKLFKSMSSGSVKKMTETAMKDKKGFAEILSFAKEAM